METNLIEQKLDTLLAAITALTERVEKLEKPAPEQKDEDRLKAIWDDLVREAFERKQPQAPLPPPPQPVPNPWDTGYPSTVPPFGKPWCGTWADKLEVLLSSKSCGCQECRDQDEVRGTLVVL